MKRNRKKQSHRYYCQNVLIDKGYAVDGRTQSLEVPYSKFKEIPIPDRYYVGELIKAGYLVQYKLF